jgi:hypothetical protein
MMSLHISKMHAEIHVPPTFMTSGVNGAPTDPAAWEDPQTFRIIQFFVGCFGLDYIFMTRQYSGSLLRVLQAASLRI